MVLTACTLLSSLVTPFTFLCTDVYLGSWSANNILLLLGLLPYAAFIGVFILDWIWCKYVLLIQEDIHPLRNLLHLLLTGLTLLMYSLVQLIAYTEVAVKGRAVCDHGRSASSKNALSPKAGTEMQPVVTTSTNTQATKEQEKSPILPNSTSASDVVVNVPSDHGVDNTGVNGDLERVSDSNGQLL